MEEMKCRIASANGTCLFFLGQAGFAIKSRQGTLLGVDMYLTECVERLEGHIGFKRLLPAMLAPDEVTFDYVVATHPHYDHFDADAMTGLMANGKTRLFASVDCANEVDRLGIDGNRVRYVRPGDRAEAADIALTFVDCDHGAGAPDAVGVLIDVDGKRLYVAGDTCLRKDYAEQIGAMGCIDVLIAPINGAYGNLNEQEAATLSGWLKPMLTVPCHYGMFASHGGDAGKFRDAMEQAGLAYTLMTVGEALTLA